MTYRLKSLVQGRSSRPRGSFRPLVESLENRLTPSVDLLSTTAVTPTPDPVAATTTGTLRPISPQLFTADKVTLPGKDISIAWASAIPGATLKGQALDTSTSPAQLVDVGYAPDPM